MSNTTERVSVAFIRQCDTCGMTTAIDLDPTPEHWRELCLYGETIRKLPTQQALEAWKTAGRCKCQKTQNDQAQARRANP